MKGFRELPGVTMRRIDRVMYGMAAVDDFPELEQIFLEESERLLPGDCICWNNWKPDWSGVLSVRCNDIGYADWFEDHQETFHEVIGHHPFIAEGLLADLHDHTLRMSDVIQIGAFKENPLYREVYRHVDSLYHMSYVPAKLRDRSICLTWNRKAMDFSERDRQLLDYLGMRLDVICRHLEEKQRLEMSWKQLCGIVNAKWSAGSAEALRAKDGLLLAELLRGKTRKVIARDSGIRVDTLDKRLGAIREQLGLENHNQLMCALAALKPPEIP